MKFVMSHNAIKALEMLDANTAGKLAKGIFRLPEKGDIKAMKGAFLGLMRLRVGDFRVIYKVVGDEIWIEQIKPRGGAYD